MVIRAVLRKSKKNSRGEMPICIKVTVKGKPSYVSMGIRCRPDEWNARRGRVTEARVNHRKINEDIANKEAETEALYLHERQAEAREIGEKLRGHDFYHYFKEQIRQARARESFRLARNDESKMRVMKLWRDPWPLSDFTVSSLKSLEAFLRKRKGKKGSLMSNTTIKNYMVRVSAAYQYFEKLVPVNPFDEYHAPAPNKSSSKAIPKDDLTKIIKAVTTRRYAAEGHQQKQKKVFLDAWLFMYVNAGMRWGDACRLRVEQAQRDLDYTMNKNDKPVSLQMHKIAQKIAREYAKGKKPGDYLFPILRGKLSGEQEDKRIDHMGGNAIRELKKVAQDLGLSAGPTPVEARHTYANKARRVLGLGGAKETLNHESEKTTKGYTDGLDNSEMTEAVHKVIDS